MNSYFLIPFSLSLAPTFVSFIKSKTVMFSALICYGVFLKWVCIPSEGCMEAMMSAFPFLHGFEWNLLYSINWGTTNVFVNVSVTSPSLSAHGKIYFFSFCFSLNNQIIFKRHLRSPSWFFHRHFLLYKINSFIHSNVFDCWEAAN